MTRENTFHQNYSGKTTEFIGKPLLFVYMTGLICKDGGGFDSQIESSRKQILRARMCVFLRVSVAFVYANVLI